MKIQSKTIILLLLLIVALISLLSYFFFTKYKFLLNYIDDRIDLKNQKIIEKYSLNTLYDNNKEHEQKYLYNLKDNLENFNNTLSQTNFIDQITELSDIEEEEIYSNEEEEIYSNEEEEVEYDNEDKELMIEPELEELQVESDVAIDQEINELPNLDNLDDNVDDYIKQILEKHDEELDLSKMEEVEKKKIL